MATVSLLTLAISAGAMPTSANGALEFNRLESHSAADLTSKANILLRQFGNPEEFKLTQEVTSKEECQSESRIRTKTICDRMTTVATTTIYAEGNGLLCKISDQAENIKCVEKTENK